MMCRHEMLEGSRYMSFFRFHYRRLFSVGVAAGIFFSGMNFGTAAENENGFSQREVNDQAVMSLVWMQTSAEYRSLCYQAYNTALERVAMAVAHHRAGDKPLAIVLDVDETVLDNTPIEACYVDTEGVFNTKDWKEWCVAGRAEAMPGAADFLQAVDKLGVDIFYVTNRTEKSGTIKNFRAVNFPLADADHLLLKKTSSYKKPRFEKIADQYDVIVYMGDNAEDCLPEAYDKPFAERNDIVDRHRAEFGTIIYLLIE